MKQHADFDEALAEWREVGGAMNHQQPTPHNSESWEVWQSLSDLEEAVDCSAKTATVTALRAGGMTEQQIATEMEDWQDEDSGGLTIPPCQADRAELGDD